MRMHGSVLPRMIVPILCIGLWATLITCLHMKRVVQRKIFLPPIHLQSNH